MKFIKGFIAGSLLGFGIGSALNERQREQIAAKVKRQTAPVRDAVSDNVQQVADTATEQMADAVDRTGDAAAAKVRDAGPDSSVAPNAQSVGV